MRASVKLLTSSVVAAFMFFSPFDHGVPKANAQIQDSNFSGGGAFQTSSAQVVTNQQKADAQPSSDSLLRARQALAKGDVQTAAAMVAKARQSGSNFQNGGDRPETIEQMIARQNQLVKDMRTADANTYNSSASSFLLDQAEGLIKYGDFETAEMLALQAKKFPVQSAPGQRSADLVLQQIQNARGSQASTSANSNGLAKQEASRLIAQAQMALAKNDLQAARSLTDKAMALNVPESAFGTGEALPWELDLKVRQAMERASQTNQAAFVSNQPQNKGIVARADYAPTNDNSRNVPASTFSQPNRAMQLYQSGVDALAMNRQEEAKRYFEMALNSGQPLDPQAKQKIKSHLASAQTGNATSTPTVGGQDEVIDDQANSLRTQVQRLIFREFAVADNMMNNRNPRGAVQHLQQLRAQVEQSGLQGNAKQQLLNVVDKEINTVNSFIERNIATIQNDEINRMRLDEVNQRNTERWAMQNKIQNMVADFNRLVEEERYAEARILADQAFDLAPEMAEVVVMKEKAGVLYYKDRSDQISENKAFHFMRQLNEVDGMVGDTTVGDPIRFNDPNSWAELSQRRLEKVEARKYDSPQEARIWNLLRRERVQGNFENTPLVQVMATFSQQLGVNIIFDERALQAEGVPVDKPTTLSLANPITLESAMNIVLKNLGLTYVVEDEVIKVTNKDGQQEELIDRVLYIGDLIVPVNNFNNPTPWTFASPNRGMYPDGSLQGGNQFAGTVPMATPQVQNVSNQTAVGMGRQMMGLPNAPGLQGAPGYAYAGSGQTRIPDPIYTHRGPQQLPGGVTRADFDDLINLIQETIAPDTWEQNGGTGRMAPFPSNLSLVVTQTQQVHDQIQDLLERLRELNDVQIVIEVRFITLQDNFFERIGVDFDFQIEEGSDLPLNQVIPDRLSGGSQIVGRDTIQSDGFIPTADLDLQFVNESFASAVPQFGGFDPNTAANFGFAILSDIEVYFLLQASKGNTRTNITQAPTVTLFNGQAATVNDQSQRPFVTSIIPVVGDFAAAQMPVITILPEGTSLNVQATASADRRFVRLNLVPFFSQIDDVDTFTFDGRRSTRTSSDAVDEDDPAADLGEDEVIIEQEGTTVQLPVLSFTTVNTAVSVPDGGTVLLGGIKRFSEGRNERGVPFLSSVPYVNRLFKNVGIGRETSSLMMMVTPRIIIQAEEEEDQVGSPGGN